MEDKIEKLGIPRTAETIERLRKLNLKPVKVGEREKKWFDYSYTLYHLVFSMVGDHALFQKRNFAAGVLEVYFEYKFREYGNFDKQLAYHLAQGRPFGENLINRASKMIHNALVDWVQGQIEEFDQMKIEEDFKAAGLEYDAILGWYGKCKNGVGLRSEGWLAWHDNVRLKYFDTHTEAIAWAKGEGK